MERKQQLSKRLATETILAESKKNNVSVGISWLVVVVVAVVICISHDK